ncbi:MAG: right-handed parallel beta-helix repeat-containing protein [Candidatus Thorarchaeota archaeon]|nr:right-handed parallel beta-helix repeat-containing protein [Candidatus Thorarchaeota archaeon]
MSNSTRSCIVGCIITLLLVLFLTRPASIVSGSNWAAKSNNLGSNTSLAQYEQHEPIVIGSDTDFADQGWPGNGTVDDPYVVENLSIEDGLTAIRIKDTTVYFIIRNCYRQGWGALDFENVTNGRVENCHFNDTYSSVHDSENCELFFSVFMGAQLYIRDSSCCRVDNCTFQGDGLSIDQSANCSVTNSTFSGCEWEAIRVYASEFCEIAGNVLRDNELAIYCYAVDCRICCNLVCENRYGIRLGGSNRTIVAENVMRNNGVLLGGPGVDYFEGNSVNGKPLGYFRALENEVIDGSSYGQLILVNCRRTVVQGGICNNATAGAQLLFCTDCVLDNVLAANNSMFGVYLEYSPNCTITRSRIIDNLEYGVFIEKSNQTTVSNNRIENNRGYGLDLHRSSHCYILNNSFVENHTGINFYTAQNCTVIDNLIVHNSGYGIYLTGSCLYNTFYGNSFGWNGIANVDQYILSHSYLNYWDDGIGRGNSWDDYFGIGIYEVDRYGVDHYPSSLGISLFTIIVVGATSFLALVILVSILHINKKRSGK